MEVKLSYEILLILGRYDPQPVSEQVTTSKVRKMKSWSSVIFCQSSDVGTQP